VSGTRRTGGGEGRLRGAQTETDEVPLFGTRYGALRDVHLQAHSPFDESYDALHHALPSAFAADVNAAVVRIPNESMPAPIKLTIELVQHDVAEQRGGWAALRHSLVP
jgi:hypothetical protein